MGWSLVLQRCPWFTTTRPVPTFELPTVCPRILAAWPHSPSHLDQSIIPIPITRLISTCIVHVVWYRMLLPAFFRSLPTAYPFRSSKHVIAISPVPAFRVPSIRRHPRLVTTSSPDLILRGSATPSGIWAMHTILRSLGTMIVAWVIYRRCLGLGWMGWVFVSRLDDA